MLPWVAFLSALVISLVSTPLVIKFAKKFNLTDDPKRKHPAILHKKLIPRAGGISPLLGFLFAVILTALVSDSFAISKAFIGISTGAILLILIGLLDDKFDLNPYQRLLSNFVVAAIVVASGVGISFITNPLGGILRLDSLIFSFDLGANLGFLSGPHTVVIWADLLALIWIVWVMNALNWSSGVDGQLTGIASVAFLVLGLASLQLASGNIANQNSAVLAFAALGGFLGLLPFSFFPQRIMPGYGGATLAGFLIAVLAIISGAKLATAVLILLVPLIDSFWAVIRRILNHRSPVWGDQFHLHHQLLKLGWTIPQVWLLYVTTSFLLGMLALSFDTQEKFFTLIIFSLGLLASLVTLFFTLKQLKVTRR